MNDERLIFLELFYPQDEVERSQWNVLKQKAGILSEDVLNKIEDSYSSSPAIVRNLFSQPKMLHEDTVIVNNILHPYIIYKTS